MEWIMHFFKDMYDFNVLVLFLISSYLLVFIDSKALRRKGLNKESRLSRVMGFVYAALGIGLYVTSLIIKG
jgi:small neutral amino acid transporter SnatA (MarC family)